MIKDDIFSTSFHAGKRTYFFDIKKTKDGNKYIKITESKRIDSDNFERHQIMVFQEDIDKFADAVAETVKEIKESDEPEKAYTLEDKRKKNPNAYTPWTNQDDKRLEILYCECKTIKELTNIFGRNAGAIRSRIDKLELKEKYGTLQSLKKHKS